MTNNQTNIGKSLKRSRDATKLARMVGDSPDGKRESNDFYPTPPKATRALIGIEAFHGDIWEPACGDGAISNVLFDEGYRVYSTDLVNRGFGASGVDFLMETRPLNGAENIVTNPPFKLMVPFVYKSLELCTGKVAMLLRITALEGIERKKLFSSTPLARVWVFSKRITFNRGGVKSPTGGMLAFAWFVWDHGHEGPPTLGWI